MIDKKNNKPIEVVDITTPALNSMLGKYFIGQTNLLNFGDYYNAWGGIFNPINSGVNIYFDIFTITNFSNQSFVGEIWLNAGIPRKAKPSPTVTSSNQAILPLPKPKAIMMEADNLFEPLSKGVSIFVRIVSPNSTLVSDSHKGSIIIPPGGTFSIFLQSQDKQNIQGTIVLTWWEEKTCLKEDWRK